MIKRHTIQCSLVLEAVNALRCHATAEEVYEYVIKEHPAVSRGTVYRNLNRLSAIGEIKKVETPGGPERFDHRCTEHYHVRCAKCGRLFDVDMDYIEDLEKSIRDAHGFEFKGHSITFDGICPECRV